MDEQFDMKRGLSPILRSAILEILVLVLIAIWLIPLYAMVLNSFKSNIAVSTTPVLAAASGLSFNAILSVWSQLEFPMLNSLIVVVPVALISTFVGAMGAYYFYLLSASRRRLDSMTSNIGFSLVALGTFIPYEAVFVPLTRLVVFLNIFDTYFGLYFAFLIFYLPTGALLMSIFISALPRGYLEAAKIDGGGDWAIFTRVILPNVMPGFIATVIFIIIEAWNQFFIPLLITSTPSLSVVSIATQQYTGGFGTLYNETFAAAFIASIVPLVIFVFLGRYFIRGLGALGTGAKGV